MLLFVITSIVVLISYGPARILLKPDLYQKAFSDLDIYESMPEIASNLLPQIFQVDIPCEQPESCGNFPVEGDLQTFTVSLAPEDWQALLEIVLSPVKVQAVVEPAFEELFAFLHGDMGQINVSLGVFNIRMTSISWKGTIHRYITSLPPCTQDELTELSITFATSVVVPHCKPPKELLDPLLSGLIQQMQPTIEKIPDAVVINLPPTTLAQIRLILLILAWIPAIPLLFLLGVLLLDRRSLKMELCSWGILFMISGLIPLSLGLVLRFETGKALQMVLGFQNIDLSSDLSTLFLRLGEYLLVPLAEWIIYPAFILSAIGLLAMIASVLIRKRSGEDAPLRSDAFVEKK
jgi:hypothetical protein